jgi:dipeptidyl aminopeptidase/acylaminoacyl peptidase
VGEEIYYSDLAEFGRYPQEQADEMLRDFDGLRGYDPIPRIVKMKRPSLWIFGGKDVSIPVKRCIHLFDSLKLSHQLPIEKIIFPKADHGLFNTELRKREDCVSLVVAWIRKQSER